MASFLKQHGKEVTGTVVPKDACVAAQAKTAFAKNKEALKKSDAILVFACGSGTQCVKENDRLGLAVFPGSEVCSACGECLLDLTEGICPVTRCAKGLLNGPCGGQNKGKCETDKEKDCAWVLIYQRLKDKGREAQLKKRLSS